MLHSTLGREGPDVAFYADGQPSHSMVTTRPTLLRRGTGKTQSSQAVPGRDAAEVHLQVKVPNSNIQTEKNPSNQCKLGMHPQESGK